MSWQHVKEILEQLDLNQQNQTNSEVDDEDVEVEIEEDVEVDIIFNNVTSLSCMLCELMRHLTSQRNSCVRPLSKFLQASLLQTE